ncbi:hypothetical protein Nepgr_023681 [Nepenthes gracilis]|uniref:Uncharacterized protein n=1 Tax=Nepenthes gracilis TaxID=150966 RepID=A0AAD3XY27_NEPGR|nr:hypothetical protein Nepgr_023681 [Nepenthes gracilis]
MGHPHQALEVAKTVLEVAEVAWSAVEHFHHHHDDRHNHETSNCCLSPEDLESLRSENNRLRELLEQNLKLLQNLSASPCLLNDCPPDLHDRLVAAVDSNKFLSHLQLVHCASVNGTGNEFPFKQPSGADLDLAEILINVDQEPSWWVWISDEMVPSTIEERSGIDDDNYVIVCEEQVVDGVANFIARCILSNPKAQKLTPEELQKTVAKSICGMNKFEKMLNIWNAGKMFYALSTWGFALAGLYKSRAVLKLAARGVHTSSKIVLRAL